MDSLYDYRKFAILYVDDEELSLKYFTRAFQSQFRVLTATNAQEGYRLLEQYGDEIALIMTDQRMPGEQGVQFLGRARQLLPRAIRILTTAYSDIEVAIEAVNSGAIYKYISKPWEVPDLEITLKRALEFFMVQRERDYLLREKLSALQKMMITDRVLSLGIVAARLGNHARNALLAARSFLDLVPEKLLDERLDLEQAKNPNYWQELYTHSRTQLRRIADGLAGLRDAARVNGATADPLQLREAVATALENLNGKLRQSGITVSNQIPSGMPPVMIDSNGFQMLLKLLLQDEMINLTAGNNVTFDARPRAEDGTGVELEIKDDGPGLPREALRSIFDPFYTPVDKYQEFGINLLACYFMVYDYGGRIDIRSVEGKGITFTLTLPAEPKAETTVAEEELFLNRVLVNDAFWERVIAAQE
jgi:two-component system, probable response regulator PhcQ